MVMGEPTAALSRLAALTPLIETPASAEVWAGEAGGQVAVGMGYRCPVREVAGGRLRARIWMSFRARPPEAARARLEGGCGVGVTDEEGARVFVDGDLFAVEEVADDVAEFVHLFVGHAGDVDGLLQLTFEPLAILRGVFGDEYAFGVKRYGEEVGHAEQDGEGLLVRRVVEVEAWILPLHGVVARGSVLVAVEHLSRNA